MQSRRVLAVFRVLLLMTGEIEEGKESNKHLTQAGYYCGFCSVFLIFFSEKGQEGQFTFHSLLSLELRLPIRSRAPRGSPPESSALGGDLD